MYLKNCWYVAGWSKDYGRSLVAERFLGEEIVICLLYTSDAADE